MNLIFTVRNGDLKSQENLEYVKDEQMSQQIDNICIYGYRLFYLY